MTQINDNALKYYKCGNDYYLEMSKGNVPGHSTQFMVGINEDLGTSEETCWDQGGTYTFLTADTELFVSSTDSGDTGITILCIGLDANWDRKTAIVTTDATDAQTQESIGNWIRFETAVIVGSTEPTGDLYFAPSDTVSGGVPDTTADIKGKMIAGNNSTRNGFFTVPAGHTAYLLAVSANTGRGNDARYTGKVRLDGGVFWRRNPFSSYENEVFINSLVRTGLAEKTDVEFVAEAAGTMNIAEAQVQYILVDNNFI